MNRPYSAAITNLQSRREFPVNRMAILGMCLAAMVGCGDGGPRLVSVSGKVTLDGKPVPNAIVTFNPTGAGGSNSLGRTDATGTYQLEFSQDRKGALVGDYVVDIVTKKVSKADMPDDGSVVDQSAFVEIPAKYRKRGTLTATVKDQSNSIDFELTNK